MESNWLLSRVVELAATYLVQSTLLMAPIAGILWILSRRAASGPRLTARLWILASVLPLATAPISVLSGWSRPAWEWSLREWDSQESTVVEAELADVSPQLPSESVSARFVDVVPTTLIESGAMQIEAPAVPERISIKGKGPSTVHTQSTLELVHGEMEPQISLAQEVDDEPVSRGENQFESIWVRVVGIGILAWISGSILRLCLLVWKLQWQLSRCELDSGVMKEELKRLCPTGHIRLLRSRNLISRSDSTTWEPFACGLWRWTIVLPTTTEQHLTGGEVQALLAHEVAHLVRRDPWCAWIWETLCTCLAFQPLNFLARRRWQQAAELLCDDWAVQRNVSAMTLASCLTKIAEWRINRRLRLGLAAAGRSGSLTRRVEWLLRSNRDEQRAHRSGLVIVTAVAFSIGLIVGAYGPRLALVRTASAGNDESMELWNDIEEELDRTLDELQRLESSQLLDPEIAALIGRLQEQAISLRGPNDDSKTKLKMKVETSVLRTKSFSTGVEL